MHRIVLSLVCAAAAAQDPGTSYRFAVDRPPPGLRLQLQQQFDVPAAHCGAVGDATTLEVIVWPHELAVFKALAPGARLLDRGRPFHEIALERAAADPLRRGGGSPYLTVAEAEAEMDLAAAGYPGLAQKVDISALPGGVRSIENRAMFALKVSDNVAVDEDEPAIVIAAQHHARELNSPIMVTGAWGRILAAYATDPQLQAVVDGYELYFVPVVNPDGVEHVWNVDNYWRKNRRNNGSSFGVDLNRNYPFLYGLCGASTNPGSQTYRGTGPASEPETRTMINLVRLLRPELYLDFHSFGQEVLRLYPPCSSISPTVAAFGQRYADDLRLPMSYATRDASASGEAPHDHWAASGALSFLTEVGTSFQPPFASTQTEEARVWPGTRRALTTWRPAVRGHVRSTQGAAPLEATLTVRSDANNVQLYSQGEVTMSRARDGRYGLWLPLGRWRVRFDATGHLARIVVVDVTAYDQPVAIDVDLDPVQLPAQLTKQGPEQIGSTVTFDYQSPGDAGDTCLFGWSLGTSPGIDLGGQRVLPLNADFLLEAAVRGNPILAPTWQTLDAQGRAQCLLAIPNDPGVVGLTTWVVGITWDPAFALGVEQWSQPVSVTPTP